MELLGAPLRAARDTGQSPIVTIAPRFAENQPPMTYCYRDEAADCRDVPRQSANFLYLRAAPSFDAPLVANVYISSAPTAANNWANKAVAGQQFARLARQGDWDAIFYGGEVAWLHNPGYANTAPARGLLVTPRPGLEAIPVYGRAYPEHDAYRTGVVTQTLAPIYEIPAGQRYVATDLVEGAYFWAPTYAATPEAAPYAVVRGETRYYQIYFNHRFGFVRASDVTPAAHRSVR